MDSSRLPPVEQLMIRHQFGQVEYASDQWFRLAATTLASATHSAGLATPAKPRAAHLRRLELWASAIGWPASSSCSTRARSSRS